MRRLLRSRRSSGPSPGPAEIPLAEIALHLPPDPVVIEAGAHTGADTVRLAAQWPGGSVHALEPLPDVWAQLEAATAGLPNVHVHRLALGAADGEAVLHVSSGDGPAQELVTGSSSLLPPKEHLRLHPEIRFEREVAVAAVTLDSFRARHQLGRVDFLWLDLQGFEPQVLAASPETLAGVRAIHTEVNTLETYAGAWLYPRFRGWLEERGFRVAAERLPFRAGGNVLFVRT